MLWTEIRKWAKEHGYQCSREKVDNTENSYTYYWYLIEDPNKNGTSTSVSKLATEIFNQMTNFAWKEYQNSYIKDYTINSVSNYGS